MVMTAQSTSQTLTEYVTAVAKRVAEQKGYHHPETALCECSVATSALEAHLGGLVTFQVETRVTGLSPGCCWIRNQSGDNPSHFLWHWVLVVPQVGILDITGAQIGQAPVRVLKTAPPNWTETRAVQNQGVGPSPIDIDPQFGSGDPLPARRSFESLLAAGQRSHSST